MARKKRWLEKRDTSLVKGSLADIAAQENRDLADVMTANMEVIVLLDVSGSMGEHDTDGGRSRHDRAEIDLRKIQGEYPGKVGLVVFSDEVMFCPTGVPERLNGGTSMAKGLRFIQDFDGTGVRFYLISDGQPTDWDDVRPDDWDRWHGNPGRSPEDIVLDVAKEFKTPISTIYIGPRDNTSAINFLKRLSALTGGQHIDSKKIAELYDPTKRLMLQDGVANG